ncbi:MAG: GntR family transcriptional regulator [Chloroflexi bacterium]|nr:GntR family transcriptional regulator [Chloroflexota bacterium]
MEIQRTKPVPLYQQLYDSLLDRIDQGELRPGDRLPSERQLCDEFNLSRATVRQAFRELSRRGLIRTVPGCGTFVSTPRSNLVVDVSLAGFTTDLHRHGVSPSSSLLGSNVITAPGDDLVDAMRLQAGEQVLAVERLRLVDSVPLALHKVYVNLRMCPQLLRSDLAEMSLFRFLRDECGLTITRAEEQVYAALATQRELDVLRLSYPASVLRTERTTFTDTGEVVEFAVASYCGEWYRLHMTLRATQ